MNVHDWLGKKETTVFYWNVMCHATYTCVSLLLISTVNYKVTFNLFTVTVHLLYIYCRVELFYTVILKVIYTFTF